MGAVAAVAVSTTFWCFIVGVVLTFRHSGCRRLEVRLRLLGGEHEEDVAGMHCVRSLDASCWERHLFRLERLSYKILFLLRKRIVVWRGRGEYIGLSYIS